MQGAVKWLDSQRKAHLSVPVTYRRGESSCELSATVGRTVFRIEDEYRRIIRYESRDYLISVADLIIDGTAIQPESGDQIIENGFIYEVMAPANEPEWRYSDSCREIFRIHTKLTGFSP